MRFIWVCKRIRENYEMTNYYNDNDARPSAHTNFFILYYISLYNLSSYLNSNSIWQIKSFRMITQKLRISTLKIRNPERDQINAYLPPDTPATALWRSDHTPPQKPSLSDVKDKLQHPAARMSWTRDGTASFERLYTGSSMRPAWKLPVKVSLCLKKCFMCVSSGWKCLI